MKTPVANPDVVQLVADGGYLHTPFGHLKDEMLKEHFSSDPILLVCYPGGDHDRIRWPDPDTEHLRSALYDSRETGVIPNIPSVLLPDGTLFTIDQ